MDSISKLVNIFRNFPTIGPRTAGRFVYYLIKLPKSSIDELISALQEIRDKVRLCSFCFNPFEPGLQNSVKEMCPICSDPRRNKNLLCVVEKEADLLSIESIKKYQGLYFILGGTISVMRKDDVSRLRIEQLKSIIKNGNFSEVIVALNPTPEGQTTSILVESEIKAIKPQTKLTHLARGIPMGGEMEYADQETLQSALEGRK